MKNDMIIICMSAEPVEYDHLKLILMDDTVEITVFNHRITLFMKSRCQTAKGMGDGPYRAVL